MTPVFKHLQQLGVSCNLDASKGAIAALTPTSPQCTQKNLKLHKGTARKAAESRQSTQLQHAATSVLQDPSEHTSGKDGLGGHAEAAGRTLSSGQWLPESWG